MPEHPNNVTPLRPGDLEHRDLRAEITTLQKQTGRQISQTLIAREAGVGKASLNRWFKGTYEGDNQGIELKVARWIDTFRIRSLEQEMMPAAPEWANTPTARRVLSALKYAQFAVDVSVIYGAAGLGKTAAARRHAELAPNTWIATMSPATSSVVPALEEIAYAVGLREVNGGGARLQRAIIARLTGTRGLLIIDEAQHLSVAALDAVRALHDAAAIGLALVGNEAVYARMTGGNRAAYLDRLYSRIGKRVRLTRATAEDVTALTNAWSLRDPALRRALTEIARRPGALRSVTKVLRLATFNARGEGRKQISVADVRAALEDLEGAES